MERSILHCDMNNFYASVECMKNPQIRDFPVAVCGDEAERHGIVLAKNYKARTFGVKTGDTVWMAKQKAPDIVIVSPNFDEYIKYSKLAQKIYCRYTDRVEPYGLDECWLDITGTEKIFGTPMQVADSIRRQIKNELGLTISVGVSFNKVFAKLGSDMKKPDAVTEITKDNFKKKIWHLPACSMIGIGRSTKKVLDSRGIFTIKDLANADSVWLKYALGKNGIALKKYANGLDCSEVTLFDCERKIKSVGRGTTTVTDLNSPEQVWCVMLELAQSVGHQLKLYKKRACGVAIQIKNSSFLTVQFQTAIDIPAQSPMIIAKAAFGLFKANYIWRENVRSVTVQAINLTNQDVPYQTDMFCDFKKAERLERLDNCIEKIREKFGKNSIKNAVLLNDLKMPELKPGFSTELV